MNAHGPLSSCGSSFLIHFSPLFLPHRHDQEKAVGNNYAEGMEKNMHSTAWVEDVRTSKQAMIMIIWTWILLSQAERGNTQFPRMCLWRKQALHPYHLLQRAHALTHIIIYSSRILGKLLKLHQTAAAAPGTTYCQQPCSGGSWWTTNYII